mmetsp:Transcript_14743/g.46276  ORF Transcript_14743/g.46276 Transcript_14743/m.46276 type:complete len:255 (-) Transcript_14743:21-785(-)
MGICKHRVKTDLFCFEHKKPVCGACLLESHRVCAVSSYREWLEDADYEVSVCAVCRDPANNPDALLRLPCHDIIHTACFDGLVQAALDAPGGAGVTLACPACQTLVLRTTPAPRTSPASRGELLQHIMSYIDTKPYAASLSSSLHQLRSLHSRSPSPASSVSPMVSPSGYSGSGLAARSRVTSRVGTTTTIQEEDKYRKRHLRDMAAALGFENIRPGSPSKTARPRTAGWKVSQVFGLLAVLSTVALVAWSMFR